MTTTVPHQALYRRWRAQTFSQIVGQEAVVETLRNAVRTERVSHALLFVGPRGTGKTSLARILAKAVNCTNLQDGDPCDACEACIAIREGTTLDVLEIDAASNRGIEEVRDLRERLAYPPGHLRRKVYILDEAHQITTPAWNALLKSLEEPPDFVIFMFASTEPSKFPPAILSRLQRFDVRRLTVPEIEGKLVRILESDGRSVEPTALTLIARLAAGGMRDAESILDQLLSMSSETVTEAAVRDLLGLADAAAVEGFVAALLEGDVASGVAILDRLEERGRDPRALLDQVVDAIRLRLLDPSTPDASTIADVARRLIAIDPDRAGIGGLRLQLELALFASPSGSASTAKFATPATPAAETTMGDRAPVPTMDPRPAAPEAAIFRAEAITPIPESTAPIAASTAPIATAPAPEPVLPEAAPEPKPVAPDRPVPSPAGAAPTEPLMSANGALSLDRVVGAWPAIVELLSGKPAIKQLILTCRPIALDGSIVTLGFPEEQAFLREIAERKKAGIEDGIREVLGHDVGVRCVVANIEVPVQPSTGDEGYLIAEAKRIFGEDLVDVAEVE